MRYLLYLTIIFFVSCGKNLDNVDKTPPSKPNIHSQRYDFSFYTESGIRPVSDGDYLLVEWEKNLEEDLLGYYLERREIEDNDTIWNRINSEAMEDTILIDNTLSFSGNENERYYYRVIAIDQDDNESEPSNVKNFALYRKAIIKSFHISAHNLIVKAVYYGDMSGRSVLRLINNGEIIYAETNDSFVNLQDTLKFEINLNSNNINLDNTYARVDIVNSLTNVYTAASYSELKSLENK